MIENCTIITHKVSGHLLREYLAQSIGAIWGAKAPGAYDRTTSKMRGLSPKIISGDSRRSENAQTHTHTHTRIQYKI
jgi:hypothetical protein